MEGTISKNLTIRYRYFGRLAGRPEEHTPHVIWWNSVVRDSRKGVARKKVEPWEDEYKQISSIQEVSLNLGSGNIFAADAAIHVGVIAHSPNHEGYHVGIRSGNTSVLLSDIQASVKQTGEYKERLRLVMKTMRVGREGNFNFKGHIEITITGEFVKGWIFKDVGHYDVVEANSYFLSTVIGSYFGKTEFPLSQGAEKYGLRLEATNKKFEGIRSPPWISINTVPVPGLYYWVYYSEGHPSEWTMLNIARIALKRRGMSEDEFIKIVDKQFEEGRKDYLSSFTDVVAAITTMICIPSISLRYIADTGYVVKTGLFGANSVEKEVIESFNDALRVGGDDCEGLGNLNGRMSFFIKSGNPKKQENSKGSPTWRRKGGWESPLLDRMQRVLHIYVGFGSLGSVTGAKLADSKKKAGPLVIDSTDDLSSNIGGHMWFMLMPLCRAEQMINRTNGTQIGEKGSFALYPGRKSAEWEALLSTSVAEGTGSMYGMILPV